MNYDEAIAQDARMIVLRELVAQIDGQLNEVAIRRVLDLYGVRRSAEWIATQVNRLAELGAVTLRDIGGARIATITRAGRDHAEERSVIAGVSKPSELG